MTPSKNLLIEVRVRFDAELARVTIDRATKAMLELERLGLVDEADLKCMVDRLKNKIRAMLIVEE